MKTSHAAIVVIAAVLVVSLATATAFYMPQPAPTASKSGQLALMATDPPISSAGVTAATATYSSVEAHSAGAPADSGWTRLDGSGSINLMSSSSVSQTVAASQVQSGAYDQVRLHIDSCKVTYQGQQYAATVTSGELTARMQSQAQVNASNTAEAIVDMRSIVMNEGNSSSPQFVFSATAFATAVPPTAVASSTLQVGATTDVQGQAWFNSFVSQTSTNLNLVATMSSGSLTLVAQNTGNADADISEVIVTPVSASATASTSLPSSLSGSAVFTVSSSGSLQASSTAQSAASLSSGVTFGANSAATLNFSGAISLNFELGGIQVTAVSAGQSYLVTIVGANTYASTVVVAA